jgi:hypothetical protein
MALKIRCPNSECRQKYSVAESHLGRLATCRKCGTEMGRGDWWLPTK